MCAWLVGFPASGAEAGLTVLTKRDNDSIAEKMVVIRLEGPIVAPMAVELQEIWEDVAPQERVLLDLNSPGGSLNEAERMVAVIREIRAVAQVDSLVRHDAMCASACVALFVQGMRRSAGGSSTWLFHGACRESTNMPSLDLTSRFLDILRDAGVAEGFLCHLVDQGYVTTPGKLWISGYELVHVYKANIITDLLEGWRPEAPYAPARDPLIQPR